MEQFHTPMHSWPGLESYSRTIHLPKSGVNLFAYVVEHRLEPTIFLLHGLGDEADTWRYLIGPLSAYGRVVAPDLPGFGRSDKPLRRDPAGFLCDVIRELAEQMQTSQGFLIGHSMGAVLTQTVALESPVWLKSQVLINGTLLTQGQRLNPQLLFMLIPGLGEWWYTRLRKNPHAAYETLRPYYYNLDGLPEGERQFLFQRVNQRVWSDAHRAAYFSTLRGLASFAARQPQDLASRLAGFEIPTLVVWGENDRIVPPANGQALAQAQPSARLVLLPETGHHPQSERPQALMDALLDDERLELKPAAPD